MAGDSKIEWTDATWNPIVGCSIVSPGCTNCYAMRTAARMNANPATPHYHGTVQSSKAGPVWTGKVAQASDDVLLAPLSWKKPRRIFVNSMGDLFHESIPDEWIDRVLAVMALCPQHTFQVLTKRAERMREYCAAMPINLSTEVLTMARLDEHGYPIAGPCTWPLPNVWLGVSCERQEEADERIPHLLQTPAAIRFVSAEPLLGPIDLNEFHRVDTPKVGHPLIDIGALTLIERLDWVIVGGESGSKARPMHPDWARKIRADCAAAGVAFFFKQWGAFKNGSDFKPGALVVMSDGRTCQFGSAELVDMDRAKPVPPTNPTMMRHVGKKAAGRTLDGVTHDAFPSPHSSQREITCDGQKVSQAGLVQS